MIIRTTMIIAMIIFMIIKMRMTITIITMVIPKIMMDFYLPLVVYMHWFQ